MTKQVQGSGNVSVSPRPYRVLMVAPTSFFSDYGCHVRILEETLTLQRMGHQVTIVTYRNGKGVPGLDIRRTLPIPWRQDYEVGSSRHKIGFDALLGLKTLQILATTRFDIIHTHLHEGALIGLVLGRLFRTPVVFDFQGSLTEEMIDHHFLSRESRIYPPLRKLEAWIDQSAPVVFTSTTNSERMLLEQWGCFPSRVQTLSDRVNTDTFVPATDYAPGELTALRRSLGIPDGRKLIVYLGLLAAYQGTDILLESMQQILAQRSDVHLLLMGFPSVGLYAEMARSMGLADYVTLPGRIPYADAPKYMALGDVAAAPKLSLTEGAGKLLNYMAVGLPTVAFETPVAREYLGLDGFFAVKGDVNSLTAKLLQAVDGVESGQAQWLGHRLRQRAIQHFSWDEAGRQIEAAYAGLVNGPTEKGLATEWATTKE